MKTKLFSIAGIFAFSLLGAYSQTTAWKLDPDHSKIQFSAVYMGINDVSGVFEDYEATVVTTGREWEGAEISVTIQANSLDTDNDRRDEHLKSEDFIHAEEHPEISFESSSFRKAGDNKFKLTGELTIRGVTHTEEFDVEYKGMVESEGTKRAAFGLAGDINRYDYNVDWNRSFISGLVVSEEIDITAEISLISKAE